MITTIDLTNDRKSNHELIKSAFLNSISPVFKLKLSKEFRETTRSCIEKVKTFYKLYDISNNSKNDCVNKTRDENSVDSCISCYLTTELEPCTSNIRNEFVNITKEILTIMFNNSEFNIEEYLKSENKKINGNIIVRYYPKGGAGYLGSHIDGNFMTFLFSNGEGLEIPKEDLSIDPDDIKQFGIPSLTPTYISLSDSDWNTIQQDDTCLIVTVGNSFFQEKFVEKSSFSGVMCPTLHRVRRKANFDRFSIPFLFNFESISGDDTKI